MSSSFKERFARVAPVRVLDRVQSGSPAVVELRLGRRLADVKSVSACLSLARRGIGMSEAKSIVEEAIEVGRAVVELPTVEDVSALSSELRQSGLIMRTVADQAGAALEDDASPVR